jgi:hypothetical protein
LLEIDGMRMRRMRRRRMMMMMMHWLTISVLGWTPQPPTPT